MNALVQFQGPLVKVHIHVHVCSIVINSRRFCVKDLGYILYSHVPVHSTTGLHLDIYLRGGKMSIYEKEGGQSPVSGPF